MLRSQNSIQIIPFGIIARSSSLVTLFTEPGSVDWFISHPVRGQLTPSLDPIEYYLGSLHQAVRPSPGSGSVSSDP